MQLKGRIYTRFIRNEINEKIIQETYCSHLTRDVKMQRERRIVKSLVG